MIKLVNLFFVKLELLVSSEREERMAEGTKEEQREKDRGLDR